MGADVLHPLHRLGVIDHTRRSTRGLRAGRREAADGREAGAREIHFRSASPPILNPDFYGIDMAAKSELFAAIHTHEEMVRELKVESLGFLSVPGLYKAIGEPLRNIASVV
jgi:glutamine phosphoribosylpyrophosphate amidotransferase